MDSSTNTSSLLGPTRSPIPIVIGWAIAVLAAIGVLLRYESTPGPAPALAAWPQTPPFALTPGRMNVVVAVHPMCPCTRATLRELDALGPSLKDTAVHVLLYCPDDSSRWTDSQNASMAAALPGAMVHKDLGGRACAALGISTSGTVLIFDKAGSQLFAGGITISRGHEGENPGLSALRVALAGGHAPAATAPVFGCSLGQACKQEECHDDAR